jgi:hypothetical protein
MARKGSEHFSDQVAIRRPLRMDYELHGEKDAAAATSAI